jgi:dTDP-4-amino-4,6-dideoxygalactose transaminase
MIAFNVPALTGRERTYLDQVLFETKRVAGDGPFTKRCEKLLEERLGAPRVLLTTSCTHALELAALLIDISPDDEVIMPSFTFVSSANAFALRGAKPVFVDVERRTMNLDAQFVREAITAKTKAIVPVHYAGVACEMDALIEIAEKANAIIVEDAAQCIGASYRGKSLGTLGALGCMSFHETKNLHCGEGGALIVNDDRLVERAEILREKGTNRSRFLRGEIDKYTWVGVGSSYIASELNAAFLLAQLEEIDAINARRMERWSHYMKNLRGLNAVELPDPPTDAGHNAHIFWLKVESQKTQTELIEFLKARGIQATFHYVPLHSTDIGKTIGRFSGTDAHTTVGSEGLVRLPLHHSLSAAEQDRAITAVREFFGSVDHS